VVTMQQKLVYPALLMLTATLTAVVLAPRRDDEGDGGAPSEASPAPTGSAVTGGAGPEASTEPVEQEAEAEATAPPAPPLPSYVQKNPDSERACGAGMILVDGVYCPYVAHRCEKFLNEERDVCAEYAAEVMCEGALEHKRFCIDEYEYPNLVGVKPVVMADWNDAGRACAVEGKRLCSTSEWEFACEGPQMWPYPYGIDRDAEACNIDQEYPFPDFESFSHPFRIVKEIDRLDQRVRSGERTRCVSPFGVRDMTGNVDEWVDNPKGGRIDKPFRSTLKGGYWGPIRARCRPITSSHNEWFRFYQVGFRCCANAKSEAPPPEKRRGKGGWAPLPRP
jgi:sulfatase modifying factor 1